MDVNMIESMAHNAQEAFNNYLTRARDRKLAHYRRCPRRPWASNRKIRPVHVLACGVDGQNYCEVGWVSGIYMAVLWSASREKLESFVRGEEQDMNLRVAASASKREIIALLDSEGWEFGRWS